MKNNKRSIQDPASVGDNVLLEILERVTKFKSISVPDISFTLLQQNFPRVWAILWYSQPPGQPRFHSA